MSDAEVEIELHDEAGEKGFKNQERPLWPCVPSYCTVPICERFGKLSTFNVFRDHWTEKHNEQIPSYKCHGCGKRFRNTKHARAHLKGKLHKGQTVTIKYIKTPNDAFIDPREILPYRLGSKEERQDMLAYQRETARRQRQHELSQMEHQYSHIPYYGENVCRDERVVERMGRLYRDTNLWQAPNHRRRIPLSDRSSSSILNQ